MAKLKAPIIYDLRGLKCPMIVLKTAKRLKNILSHEQLQILSDDPLAYQDLSDLCHKINYDYHIFQHSNYIAFTIIIPNKK